MDSPSRELSYWGGKKKNVWVGKCRDIVKSAIWVM